MSTPVNRRQFVKAAASATAVLGPALHASGKQPAAGRVRIGLIGCCGRRSAWNKATRQPSAATWQTSPTSPGGI